MTFDPDDKVDIYIGGWARPFQAHPIVRAELNRLADCNSRIADKALKAAQEARELRVEVAELRARLAGRAA